MPNTATLCGVPILATKIHFYGHWLMGGQHSQLSAPAKFPTTQILVIGNFIGALAFAIAGWKDLDVFLRVCRALPFFHLVPNSCGNNYTM